MGKHDAYILASYLASGLILGTLILASLLAHRGAARRLAQLEREK